MFFWASGLPLPAVDILILQYVIDWCLVLFHISCLTVDVLIPGMREGHSIFGRIP